MAKKEDEISLPDAQRRVDELSIAASNCAREITDVERRLAAARDDIAANRAGAADIIAHLTPRLAQLRHEQSSLETRLVDAVQVRNAARAKHDEAERQRRASEDAPRLREQAKELREAIADLDAAGAAFAAAVSRIDDLARAIHRTGGRDAARAVEQLRAPERLAAGIAWLALPTGTRLADRAGMPRPHPSRRVPVPELFMPLADGVEALAARLEADATATKEAAE
ncbi:hypothetical protein [Roseospirillum parvum]|uniref:Uncharacterized protein n=1 Tax=Roseospirillum parvum TaxID=83401 RepID=A0A1G8E6S7_9PROT|nr:hypothetical protein [Roseospirillum parvum]SDH65577.1 hypothetical protein SAMN05421742_10953 [Roseospirillum parvum]